MIVLNPTIQSDAQPLHMARRLDSLNGAVIGVLSNGKFNADPLFAHVEELLRERHGVRELLWRRKHNFSAPAPAEMVAELSACDAILTGIGD